ncbi:MAG: ATP-dependent helicase RecG [Acidimicrobiales bacterium]|nr:ATP-dependent helicase RecG [Acidimicrobiales bacterium]
MLKKLRTRLSQSLEDLDDERVTQRFSDFGAQAIADAPTRTPILLAGEIQGLQVVPRAGSPSLEVTIGDGSGRAIAVFTGRRRLGGVDCGRRVVVQGVARRERGRLMILNPAYTIVE